MVNVFKSRMKALAESLGKGDGGEEGKDQEAG